MNSPLPELIGAIRRTLRDAVAPELASDYARGQLAAVDDILGKLAGMTVWSPEADEAQAQALHAGIERFRARAAALASHGALPLPGDAGLPGLRAAEADIASLIDWLDAAQAVLDAPAFAELDEILRLALREQLRVQRKRIPLTDFGAMTAAAREP